MNRLCTPRLLATLAAVSVFATHVAAQSGDGAYRIESSVVAGGGRAASGGAYRLDGTFGQSASAILSASDYRVYGGFWASAASSAPTDPIFANGFDP